MSTDRWTYITHVVGNATDFDRVLNLDPRAELVGIYPISSMVTSSGNAPVWNGDNTWTTTQTMITYIPPTTSTITTQQYAIVLRVPEDPDAHAEKVKEMSAEILQLRQSRDSAEQAYKRAGEQLSETRGALDQTYKKLRQTEEAKANVLKETERHLKENQFWRRQYHARGVEPPEVE